MAREKRERSCGEREVASPVESSRTSQLSGIADIGDIDVRWIARLTSGLDCSFADPTRSNRSRALPAADLDSAHGVQWIYIEYRRYELDYSAQFGRHAGASGEGDELFRLISSTFWAHKALMSIR